VSGNNLSKLVLRFEQTKDGDNPAIYYNLIALANQLIKEAIIQDKLVVEKNVLYFEMGAAGSMNHFLCLVIWGIYDYLGLHKNKE
jgi:hypothetical protein